MISSRIIATTLIGFLTACSSASEQSDIDLVTSYFSPQEVAPPSRFTNLFSEARPILDVEFVDLGVAGKLVLEEQDGPYARYLSADLGGIVLQRGLLHSLYGFGEPLVGADLSEPFSLIIGGRAGVADRFHTYADGEDRAQIRTYRCEILVVGPREVALETGKVQTLLVSERCSNLDQSFENFYWLDRRRSEVIQSRQWAGQNVGNLSFRVTRPM